MNRVLIIGLVLAAPVACKKDEKKKDQPAEPAKPAEQTKADEPAGAGAMGGAAGSAMPDAFKPWDMAARQAAWQGSWHLEPSAGFQVAVEVKGDKVRQWDGKEEKALTFALQSPCEASFTEQKPDGSKEGTVYHYTLKDGKLVTGLMDAGSRKGTDAIACISNAVFTLSGGTCLQWEMMFDKWESKPGTCSMDDKGFKATIQDREKVLVVVGDALLDEQNKDRATTAFPDFEAAKAARK